MEDVLKIITPALVALLVELLKRIIPRIPKYLLPFIATAAGTVAQLLAGSDVASSVVTGAASVGAYEAMHQLNKAAKGNEATFRGFITFLVLCFGSCITSCAMVKKSASDPVYVGLAASLARSQCFEAAADMQKETLISLVNTLESVKAHGPSWFALEGKQYGKTYDLIWYAYSYAVRHMDSVDFGKDNIYVKTFTKVYDACLDGLKLSLTKKQ